MEREKISLGLQGIDDEFIVNAKSSQKKRWLQTTIGKVVLVACLPLLCAAGIATGVFVDVIDVFAPLFGGTNPQTEIIQEIGRPIGASDTSNGVTITVDAIIGDENTVVVQYSISNEDGSPFNLPEIPKNKIENGIDYNHFLDFGTFFADNGQYKNSGTQNLGSGWKELTFQDRDTEDGKIEFIEKLYYERIPMGKKIQAEFSDLGYYMHQSKGDGEDYENISFEFFPLIEGYWNITYRLNYGESNKTLKVQDSFVHEGREVSVSDISISPFSVIVECQYPKFERESSDDYEDFENFTEEDWELFHKKEKEAVEIQIAFSDGIEFYVSKKDGTQVSGIPGGGTSTKGSLPLTSDEFILYFDEIVPLEDIATVTFGDITVEVS